MVLQSSPRVGGRGRKDGAGALLLAALAVMVLGYIGVFFGRLLQAAVSRHRERLADAEAEVARRDEAVIVAAKNVANAEDRLRLLVLNVRAPEYHRPLEASVEATFDTMPPAVAITAVWCSPITRSRQARS